MTQEERAYNYAASKKTTKFTVGEIAKHYDDGYTDGYKDAVNKTINFLWDCGCIDTLAIDEIIDKYKKYMEK